MLPAESEQARWIEHHLVQLDNLPETPTAKPAKKRRGPAWLAPLAAIGSVLAKSKALLALFKLKFLFSFAAFFAVYWSLYGIRFGLGLTVQILIHELGHYLDIRRRCLNALSCGIQIFPDRDAKSGSVRQFEKSIFRQRDRFFKHGIAVFISALGTLIADFEKRRVRPGGDQVHVTNGAQSSIA